MADDLRSQRMDELIASATAFFRAVEALRVRSAARVNLTATEFRALARLVEFGPDSPKALATSMAMSTATITAVTDRLVARQLVTRVPNQADRRSVLLTPTDEGLTLVTTMYNRYRQMYIDTLAGHSDENLDVSRQILTMITASFNADLGPDEPPARVSV